MIRRYALVILTAVLVCGSSTTFRASDCSKTSIGLSTAGYVRTPAHEEGGLAAKAAVVPRDTSGAPPLLPASLG